MVGGGAHVMVQCYGSRLGKVFLGRAIQSGPTIVAANFRNRISMQTNEKSHHGVKESPFFYWPKLMDKHVQILGAPGQLMGCFEVYPSTCWVQILGAPVQLMGCFEVYPSTCWVSCQNMNVELADLAQFSFYVDNIVTKKRPSKTLLQICCCL